MDKCVHVFFGNVCNICCSYCISGDDHTSVMNLDVLQATIRVVNNLKNVALIRLIGGEPTVYEHIVDAVCGFRQTVIELRTNGLLSDKLKEIINVGSDNGHRFNVVVSVHHEYWQRARSKYINAVLTDYNFLRDNPAVDAFCVEVLIDRNDITVMADIVNWVFTNIDKKYVSFDYVKRDFTVNEFVKTISLAKQHLPRAVADLIIDNSKQMVTGNAFYGKPCQRFLHFFEVNYDGKVLSSLCKQVVAANKLITDDDFELTQDETICKQQTVSCFDNCLHCHGFVNLTRHEVNNVLCNLQTAR